ncbi:MerR family transcriptional regulator [Dickeya lacustris]|uniref:MerR family transcriptional regulator n=1 Tax=Dickeya lacustris TaxID=2259638 RepID=A0ABY8G7Y7_9GAMM|nr:MerR family transcriptional regulator [Dickeya lacustris]WFN56051.1 MerR family transcriptional regulator [Dickeya lacustris]
MTTYSISEFSARCGVNAVTLRAWQRRYGLLSPKRTEGGHRVYDDADLIEVGIILSWIQKGVPIGQIKRLLEGQSVSTGQGNTDLQDALLTPLQSGELSRLRSLLYETGREYPSDYLVEKVLRPLRARLASPQETIQTLHHLLDSVIISYCAFCLEGARKRAGTDVIVAGWQLQDTTEVWLEALRRTPSSQRCSVVPQSLTYPRPELMPGCSWLLVNAQPLTAEQHHQHQQWLAANHRIELVILSQQEVA